ncbi:MAG: efflux transporter outer membrane subunit [Kiritimatiellae bacterium]|nr:efflux transporter outer membrane subunit [Kiritimatiellia bacterium]
MEQNRISPVAGVFAAAAFAIGGCAILPAVGPDYEEPEMKIPEYALPDAGYPTTNRLESGEFKTAGASEDVREAVRAENLKQWWDRFEDPELDKLIERAVSTNLTFLIARERLAAARWRHMGTFAAFMPQVSAEASAVRLERGKNSSSRWGTNKKLHSDVFAAGFDASWEIDVFGGPRRETQAAEAEADSALWSYADALVSLTAEVAREYSSLRTVQARIDVSRRNLALQKETYEILKSRLDSGIGDELAVNQSKYVMEQTHAAIPPLLAEETRILDALAILTGDMPGSLDAQLARKEESETRQCAPVKLENVPIDLIRSRPDVRTAERNLAAQVAYVGVAKSLWFPKLYINGSLGLESVHPSKLLRRDALMGSIGPAVSWPIFQGGRIYASVKAEEAKMRSAVYAYELSIQKAYAEVRDVYAAYTEEYHRCHALEEAVKAASDAVAISKDLYRNGLKDFTAVIDAQRSLLSLEEALVISRGAISERYVSLCKALGGSQPLSDIGM